MLLIRALLTDPDLLLLDEPFNSLDSETREEIYKEITEICRKREISVLIASHNTDTEKFVERTVDLEKEQKLN